MYSAHNNPSPDHDLFLLDPDLVPSGLGFSPNNSLSDHLTEPKPKPDPVVRPRHVQHVVHGELVPLSVSEQRRLRRKISNRESARRSRARKQHHLDGLRTRLARLEAEKQTLTNQLRAVLSQSELVTCQNYKLQAESIVLRRRLAQAHRWLILRQLQQLVASPCNGFGPGSGSLCGFDQALASLIS